MTTKTSLKGPYYYPITDEGAKTWVHAQTVLAGKHADSFSLVVYWIGFYFNYLCLPKPPDKGQYKTNHFIDNSAIMASGLCFCDFKVFIILGQNRK
jgi:hypothetical protein